MWPFPGDKQWERDLFVIALTLIGGFAFFVFAIAVCGLVLDWIG